MLVNKPKKFGHEIRFVCITDNPSLISEDYAVSVRPSKYSDLTKNARDVKVNGVDEILDFDIAIWHDSSIRLDCSNLQELLDYGELFPLSVFHHKRYCAYLEAIACIENNKDHSLRITGQMIRYYLKGFPSNVSLNETGIMVFSPNLFIGSDLQKIWWEEIENWSRRDQLSFAYAKWKTETHDLGLLDGAGMENKYSLWIGHHHQKYQDASILSLINLEWLNSICKKLLYEMRRRR